MHTHMHIQIHTWIFVQFSWLRFKKKIHHNSGSASIIVTLLRYVHYTDLEKRSAENDCRRRASISFTCRGKRISKFSRETECFNSERPHFELFRTGALYSISHFIPSFYKDKEGVISLISKLHKKLVMLFIYFAPFNL